MENKVIELKNISKIYKTGGEDTVALDKINLEIGQGEFVAIMGPSGSGKSTLMHILGLLDVPTSGEYSLDGQNVSKLKKNAQAEIRNEKIGFVFQQFNLLPRTKVIDNILLPTIYGKSAGAKERAKKIIKQVGLENRVSHKSNQLSGGQIQRVAVARALIMEPSLILADEPTGNLDSKNSREIMELLADINKSGATIVVITHDPDIAKFAKRMVELKDGKIIKDTK
jgi:putative ABC transport system ATP-binding protein